MSRIFDSLKKAGGRAADVALPVINEARGIAADPGGADGSRRAAAAEPEPKPQPETRMVPVRPLAKAAVLPFDGSHPGSAEQYRIIRTKLVQHAMQPRLIAVSSAGAQDGKTTTAINIAAALSLKSDVKVLLVDGDLRHSSCSRALQIPQEPGLGDVLVRKCVLNDAVLRVQQLPNLYVLPAGSVQSQPSELLDCAFAKAVFQTFRNRFRFVIVDCPPVDSVADYDILQDLSDGVLVVLRPDHTNRALALQTLASVPREKRLGVVLNHVKPWFLWKTPHDTYSYYSEGS